jgi:hypothetical protein
MTIREMLHQVALFSAGKFVFQEGLNTLVVPLPGGRKQIIYSKEDQHRNERVGILYTFVGEMEENNGVRELLELNRALRYSHVALDGNKIMLIAKFSLANTSINECAPILQELAAIADELERKLFDRDVT